LEPVKDLELFRYTYDVTVRFNEVICSTLLITLFISIILNRRILLAKDLDILPQQCISLDSLAFYMARNEINYLKVALFEDRLRIYSHIYYIKHSSFGFDHVIKQMKDKKIIAEGS
jgi:acyl-CoA thioesterase FadM